MKRNSIIAVCILILSLLPNKLSAQPGSLDITFNPGSGANGLVNAIAVQPNAKVLISGYFISVNGTNRHYIARLNSDGNLDSSFDPGDGSDYGINASALNPDGTVLIGGAFNIVNASISRGIARLRADGSFDTSFTPGSALGVGGEVFFIAVQTNGQCVVGGKFTTSYNAVNHANIARLNTNGSVDTAFNLGTGANDSVLTVALQND
jgi:uncharacterized delta-60 repeat protein